MRYSDIVDYDKLDPFKEEGIRRFKSTLGLSNRLRISVVPESIGLTAVAIDLNLGDFYIAFNIEGLGTKNMIAEAMAAEIERVGKGVGKLEERALFSGIGRDEMACSLNDLSAIGATPFAFEPIIATGNSDYLTNRERAAGIIDGFERGAQIARAPIPGGETPTLKGIVNPNTIDVAGASVGLIKPKARLITGDRLTEGLTIYGISSSGIMANGVSLARKIADKLQDGYFIRLPSGRTLGEALLTPATIYSSFVDALFEKEVDVRFMQPITGHGWAKIMRTQKDLRYVIKNLPEPQEEFRFLQEKGPVSDEEAYRVWNMGVGFVVIAPNLDSGLVESAAETCGHEVYRLGQTEKGERAVVLTRKNITYKPK